jgi:CheY-like chemotaxis protein
MAVTVVALVQDLFFLTKIRETAKALGVSLIASESQGAVDAIAEAQPHAILLDLNSPAAVARIRTLKADPRTRGIRIVGFVSHVQGQLIAAAREAGCDTVMARSAFAQQLPNLLRDLAGGTERSC